jgi:hypothetical protein
MVYDRIRSVSVAPSACIKLACVTRDRLSNISVTDVCTYHQAELQGIVWTKIEMIVR